MDSGRYLMQDVARTWLPVGWLSLCAPMVLATIPVSATDPLRKLLFPSLKRGKLLLVEDSSSTGRKGRIWNKITVPQSFFTSFYLLGLFGNSLLLFTALAFAGACSRPTSVQQRLSTVAERLTGTGRSDLLVGKASLSGVEDLDPKYIREAWKLAFLLLVFEVHLVRRLYECLVVSVFNPSARMTFFGYLLALGYYVAVPPTLFLQGFSDEVFVRAFHAFVKEAVVTKGSPLADTLPEVLEGAQYLWTVGWTPWVGGILCLYGSIHQYRCHEILAAIRTEGQTQQGVASGRRTYEYGIPRGDWFELLSCPHFLAEILIYAGLVIISGGTNPAMWLLLSAVVANLALNAKLTHEWYLSKFDDYPRSRHPIFPYVG